MMATTRDHRAAASPTPSDLRRVDTVIVGGGQTGLAVGYHLMRRNRPFVILDAEQRTGDAWRRRWDSLVLFTPARYSGLPGWPLPAAPSSYPTKDAVADYLEAYAARFNLPIHRGVRVDRLTHADTRFLLTAGDQRWEATHVVVATGAYQQLRLPAFAADLDPGILQLDTDRYRNPSQLRSGPVLVVGAGNSGAEIAHEVAGAGHPTFLSGPDTGRLPVRTGSRWDRVLTPPFWWFVSRVLTVDTAIGRRVRPKALQAPAPLERIRPKELKAAGVQRLSRTVGIRDGRPILQNGRVLDVANVIWCTGARPDFGWIDLPVFELDGQPRHGGGVVASPPGLYFAGLWFLTGFTSSLLGGVGRDAERIAEHINARSDALNSATTEHRLNDHHAP
jgi:putative flavoprotein involved in K+ transport